MKDKSLIMTIAMVAALAALVIIAIKIAPLVVKPKAEKITYNHFEFEKLGEFWYTQWQNGPYVYNLPLRYNPYEVENVPVLGELDDNFNDMPLYVTIDPTVKELKWVGLAKGEFLWSAVGPLEKNVTDACMVDVPDCEGFPIVTCDDTDKAVVMIIPEGKPSVKAEGTCVILTGENIDLVKSVDRFLYQWYGIIPQTA